MKHLMTVVLVLSILLGLAVLCFFVPDGLMLNDAMNAYYTAQPSTPYNLQLYPYGCMLALGTVAGMAIVTLMMRHVVVKRDALLRFMALALWLGLLCSRAFYCLVNILFYAPEFNRLAFLKIWEGGFSMSGAMLGISLAAYLVIKSTNVRRFMDATALLLALFVVIERFGEKFTEMGIGLDVDIVSIFTIEGILGEVLNVWLIESLVALGILITLATLLRRDSLHTGDYLPFFFLLYGSTQILMESLRADQHMIWGFVKVQQVLAMLTASGAALYFGFKARRMVGALLVSGLIAIGGFGLEKALDRLDISPILLYAAFIVLIAGYLSYGLYIVRKTSVMTSHGAV